MPGTLRVRVLAGRGLPIMDRSSETTDAFVEVKFGSTVQRTEIYPKSLNPKWNSDWFQFEAEDSTLQDECLQFRVMDYDTYSANDAIGRVYVDLSPLLSGRGPPQIAGWFPIYDTMNGIRGELSVLITLDLFADISQFRQSSCDIEVFATSGLPYGRALLAVHGLVEELLASNDPEHEWIDKIRTPRASNEARQSLFSKMAGELMRRIGKKVSEMGGNAVIGYTQYFDFEGESGVVIRGNGTAVTLEKVEKCDRHVFADSISGDDGLPLADRLDDTVCYRPILDSDSTSAGGGVPATKSNRSSVIFDVATSPGSAKMGARSRRLSPCFQSQGRGLSESQQKLIEYPFLTINQLPPNLLVSLVGFVASHSVKLLRNVERPEDRYSWWRELRLEICGHMKALNGNAVVGYREELRIFDEVCVLTVYGTAVQLDFNLLLSSVLIRGGMDGYFRASCRPNSLLRPAESKKSLARSSKLDGVLYSDSSPTSCHLLFEAEQLDEDCFVQACSIYHIPSPIEGVLQTFSAGLCSMCGGGLVPSILICSIDPPLELTSQIDTGILVQAKLVRRKSNNSGDSLARHLSDILPFAEHDLHSQLMSQALASSRNAIFGVQRQITVSSECIIIILSGTAVRLPGLDGSMSKVEMLPKKDATEAAEKIESELVKAPGEDDSEFKGDHQQAGLRSSTEAILIPASHHLGYDVYAHATLPLCTFYSIANLRMDEDLRPLYHHMFTRTLRFMVSESQICEAMISKRINWIIKSTMFKFRKLKPRGFFGVTFGLEIPGEDEVQISINGVAVTCNKTLEDCDSTLPSGSKTESHGEAGQFETGDEETDLPALHHPADRAEVFVTALMEPPGGVVAKYIGYYDFFFIRETNAVREFGGTDSFVQMALSEIVNIVRCHVTAFGGDGMVSFKFNVNELSDSVGRNQAQYLVGVSGDIVTTQSA